jgi:hypothetical protein
LENIDPDKEHFLLLAVGYDYLRTTQSGKVFNENRVTFDLTPGFRPTSRLLLRDRNWIELRWINGTYSTTYRNEPSVEVDLLVHGIRFTPFGTAAVFYDSPKHSWDQEWYTAGVQFPYKRSFMLETYYRREHCATCTPENWNAGGITLNFLFTKAVSWRRSPPRGAELPFLSPFLLLAWFSADAGLARAAPAQAGPIEHIVIGDSTAPLYGPWKFHLGDSPIDPINHSPLWSEPGFDDSTWETVDLTPRDAVLDPVYGVSGMVPGWTNRGHAGHWGRSSASNVSTTCCANRQASASSRPQRRTSVKRMTSALSPLPGPAS